MQLPAGTTIAVADGAKLSLFRNTGNEQNPKLTSIQAAIETNENRGSGGRHHNSSANPDGSQLEEDGFAVGIAEFLNKQALSNEIAGLVIIAAPRTLGELRKHYHAKLSAVLLKEIAKDLTGHSASDIEKAIASA